MTSDQPPSGATPPGGKSRRRPPTIDLTATEIASTPVSEPPAPPSEQAMAAPSEPTATPEQPAAASEPTAKAEDAPPTAPAAAAAEPVAPESTAEPPPQAEAQAPRMEDAPAAPEAAAAEPPPRRRSTAWLPLASAGVAGGAVVAIVLGLASLLTSRDTGIETVQARLMLVEQQLRDVGGPPAGSVDARALEELRGRLTRIETTLAARPSTLDPAVANRISAIEGEVKAMAETVGILGRRSDEAVATAREARQRAEATAAALAELAQKVNRPGPPMAERSELEALAARVAAVERAAKTVEGELAKRASEMPDRAGRLAVAAALLNAAVERGTPFTAELATVKSLAADPKLLAPLEPFAAAGVPSAVALARELAGLAPALQQAAGGAPSEGGGILARLAANAERLVRIRPLDEVAGSDPAAIVARVEFKAMHADLAGALAELAALPEGVRAPAQAWIGKAQARAAAIEASRKLAADALAGLGK
jgi:hypothetical protein